MKKILNKNLVGFLASLLIGFMFTACSSNDDGNDDGNKDDIIFTIKAGDKTYSYKYFTASTAPNDGSHPNGFMTISGTANGSDYGVYNGASLMIDYSLQGEGEYAIVRNEDFLVTAGAKEMTIKLSVTSADSESVCVYEMVGGKAIVKVVDGKYHITIKEPSTGTLTYVVGEGFAESVSLLTYDVYDRK